MKTIDPQSWKADLPDFREKTELFYSGEMAKGDYKGFSGLYGSYAQKGGQASMLRLRMTAGVITKEKLAFIAEMIRKHSVKKVHFTTCQAVQFHDLEKTALYDIMEKALDVNIVTMGGGGDFPRNVMCTPLSGILPDEYFNVRPYAEKAADYLMNFVKAEKMPRKLKVCFSGSEKNIPHATFRDLGFVAREDGKFDVYCAGGLGNNPKFGVKAADAIDPENYLYYIKAMWTLFRKYGNYENRGKARTRYMQDVLETKENFIAAYRECLDQVFAEEGDALMLTVEDPGVSKTGTDDSFTAARVIKQKQTGLYAVCWHPIGGVPVPSQICDLYDTVKDMDQAEVHITPDESAYIVNLTAEEAKKVLAVTEDGAKTLFETSVSCIGASICQVGLRDSQALLRACVDAVSKAGIPDGALPQMHISGCPSSCGTHQTGAFGFRGATKKVDGANLEAFLLCVNGCDIQGKERFGEEVGTIAASRIPDFLVKLGQTVAASGKDYAAWNAEDPNAIAEIAKEFI